MPRRALRRGAGEVDEDILAGDFHRAAHQDRLFKTVAPGLARPFAGGQFGDLGAHRGFGTANDFFGNLIDGVELEFVHHFEQRPAAGFVARGLGVKIADHFVGLAHVGADDLHENLVGLAAVEQLHDRDAQPLFEDFPRFGGKNPPADVGAMAGVGEQGDQLAVLEDRRGDGDVVDLPGGLPRIVGDQHVARRQPVRRKRREKMFHRCRHGVDMAGRAADRLRDHPPLGVEHAAGQVLAFAHDGAEGGADQRVLLLVGHR